MNNIYNDPAYADVQSTMHKRYDEMREKYGDTDALDQQFIESYLNR
jgi:predicted outer membrane protein